MTTIIAVCTYKRPNGVARTIKGLIEEVEGHGDVEVLVVDNDPDSPHEETIRRLGRSFGEFSYLSEPRRGLVHARNAALRFAREKSADLIFIDDDESPVAGWLDTFLSARLVWPEAVLAGPIIPDFELSPPKWDPEGKFWTRTRHRDRSEIDYSVSDGNIYYPAKLIASWSYDETFNLSGAQETMLLKDWLRKGGVIVWLQDAAVIEVIPARRMTLEYATSRRVFEAQSYVWVERRLGSGTFTPLRRMVLRVGRATVLQLVGAATFSAKMKAKARLDFAVAIGTWRGLRALHVDRYVGHQHDVAAG